MKLINAETLVTVLEEQKKRAVGYEHSVLEQVIKTIRMMPEVDPINYNYNCQMKNDC